MEFSVSVRQKSGLEVLAARRELVRADANELAQSRGEDG
jgi:hypothetical protein